MVKPATDLQRENWPSEGEECIAGDMQWYPNAIEGVAPTFRKPGYSQDFMNWTEADYTYRGITDHLVGAQYNGQMNWLGNKAACRRAGSAPSVPHSVPTCRWVPHWRHSTLSQVSAHASSTAPP